MQRWADDHVWSAIHVERRRLAADLADLDDDGWAMPTLCGQWSVEEVVAHLTAAANMRRGRWLRSVAAARGDFDLHNARRLAEYRGPAPRDTLAHFVAAADLRIRPSRPTWAWLGEVIVHASDIRMPLGIDTAPDQKAVDHLAECFVGKNFTVPSRDIAKNLTLRSTDGDFRHGDGPVVTGRTLDLVMAMAVRPSAVGRLSGDGVAILAERVRAR